MRRHAVASIAAAAVAVATSFAGLAGAVTDPIELLGWGQAPDTYDFETGLLSSDGKYVWMGASTSPGWIIKFMTNPGGISPTRKCLQMAGRGGKGERSMHVSNGIHSRGR